MTVRKFTAAAGLACTLGASLSGAGESSYRLSFTLSQDGRPFASPALLVYSGVPAVVEVMGPDGYRFDVKLDAAGDGNVKVGMHLSRSGMIASPTLLAKLGEAVSTSVKQPGIGEFGISFTASIPGS